MRAGADGITDYQSAVGDNFLKFRGSIGAAICGQVYLAARVDRVERTKATNERCGGKGKIETRIGQKFGSLRVIVVNKRGEGAKDRKVFKADQGIFRNLWSRPIESAREPDGSPAIARANALPYSTSRSFDSASAALAEAFAAGALPRVAS